MNKSFYLSKRFWTIALAAIMNILYFFFPKLGEAMPLATINGVMLTALSWIALISQGKVTFLE